MIQTAGHQTAVIVLTILLLIGGLYYLLSAVLSMNTNRAAAPMIIGVVSSVYLILAGGMFFVFASSGNLELMLLTLILLLAIITFGLMIWYLVRNHAYINKGALVLFLVYLLALMYMTLFSRLSAESTHDTGIRMNLFDWFSTWRRTGKTDLLKHFLLNVVMFIPLGLIFPFIDEEYLDSWAYAIPVGFMLSVFIEAVQMVLKMGQSDINDILGNALGAFIGMGLYKIYSHFVYE